MGFKSLHTPPIINLKNNEINFQWPWWLSTYDALTDLPVPYFYKYFDENYPNAKFILTVRNEKDWLKSCANHFDEDLNLLLERPEPHFKALLALCEKMYGSLLYDEKLFRKAFIQHNLAVEEYFKGRDDFLVLDVCAGDPWPELCSFLGVPKPTVEFPHGNATKKSSKYLT